MQSNHFSRHAQQVHTVAHGGAGEGGSDPAIARSWLRCLEEHHLDPTLIEAPVVLEHGRITDIGTHAELLQRSERYLRVYRMQFESALDAGGTA